VRSHYLTGDIPWTDVLISGHALDPSGKKISKSKLSVAEDPMPILEQFSADAVRYWAASVRTGGDTLLSEEVFRNGAKLVTKLWNASKFALSHLAGYAPPAAPPELNATDRWLLARLYEVVRRATQAMDEYEFAVAKSETERFFWTDFCDNYLELIKLRLYGAAGGAGNGQAGADGSGGGGADRQAGADAAGARYVLSQALPAQLKLPTSPRRSTSGESPPSTPGPPPPSTSPAGRRPPTPGMTRPPGPEGRPSSRSSTPSGAGRPSAS
jgi:valyl-tRNA synthetase